MTIRVDGEGDYEIDDNSCLSSFDQCDGFAGIANIPAEVRIIGREAFKNCRSLSAVNFDDGSNLETIGDDAFYGTSLRMIFIPRTVKYISSNAFNAADRLAEICVDERNANYESVDGNLYSHDGNVLICVKRTATEFCFPQGVSHIGAHAFCGCEYLSSLDVPDSVATIGDFAFCDCKSLAKLSLPNFLSSIGEGAFSQCFSLRALTVSNGISSISDQMFDQCLSLENVRILGKVTHIGQEAFAECVKLSDFVIPSGVKSIDKFAFFGCISLDSLNIPASVSHIGAEAFDVSADKKHRRDTCLLQSIYFEDPRGWSFVDGYGVATPIDENELRDPSSACRLLSADDIRLNMEKRR